MAESLDVDYLVIGAGAMGMAFVDTLLTDTQKTVAIVDRYARPSGHWTVAYPYVRLHQPSAFYGVNSRQLGQDSIDEVGWNKGLSELASRDEVCAYYDHVMRHTFLPSGRVAYYPKHEYTGERQFHSILTNKVFQVGKRTRIVDATYMKVKVPSMSPPVYEVAKDVQLITPNNLPSVNRPYANYTVVGAGKTGIDACLWLLANDVDPTRISWIMPRDSFFLPRDSIQPGPQFAEKTHASLDAINGSVMAASSMDDLLKRWVACQELLQLDDEVWPTMFRCATVSLAEFEQLQKIRSIIRQGRVVSVEPNKVTLQNGSYTPDPDSLFIDCSADALAKQTAVPVFQNDKIRLQSVRYCQQVFSAAFISHVEASYDDDETKNKLCRPVPHPNEGVDFALVQLQSHLNGLHWNSQPKTAAWLQQARLDWFGTFMPPVPKDPTAAQEMIKQVTGQLEALCSKLRQIVGDLSGKDATRLKAQLALY